MLTSVKEQTIRILHKDGCSIQPISTKIMKYLFIILFLLSCQTVKYNHSQENNYSQGIGKGIITNQIMIGMTSEQVMSSWGKPYAYQRNDSENFIYCVYKLDNGKIYLYFDRNKLIGLELER